ncbi:MAG: hypothetical protein KDD27_15055 [Saprospiraceae bacterium]|nr:hypothetical protein [Saprospiraceae bacterium]
MGASEQQIEVVFQDISCQKVGISGIIALYKYADLVEETVSGLLLSKVGHQIELYKKLVEMAESNSAEKKAKIDAVNQSLELLKSKEGHFHQLLVSLQDALGSVKTLELAMVRKDAGLKGKEDRIRALSKQFDKLLCDAERLRSSLLLKEENVVRKEEILSFFEVQRTQRKEEKPILPQQFEVVGTRSSESRARSNEDRSRLDEALERLSEAQSRLKEMQERLDWVATENSARGNYIEYLNGFVATLEKGIAERDRHLAQLQNDFRQKMEYITELKSSFSFRLGLVLTAPFRGVSYRLKMAFWMKFLGIAIKNPGSFFKNINPGKITILREALKNEPPSLILQNFRYLLSGPPRQMAVVQVADTAKPLSPAKKEESIAGPHQPVAESIESSKTYYFIDQLEELDFYFSIRGWLFAESHEVKGLSIVMSQGDQSVESEVYYHIDRFDVYQHYGNKNGLRSGFMDSIEKPFIGKTRLKLVATFSNGAQSTIDLGETEFSKPFLDTFNSAMLANRLEFKALDSRNINKKPSVAIYTNTGGNYFFNEIKALIAKGFQSLGYLVLELDETDGFENDALLHIVIACHEFFGLGDGKKYAKKPSNRLILLNAEQPSSAWFRQSTVHYTDAIEVWDINYYSCQRLRESIDHVRFLPLGFVKDLALLGEVRQLPENHCTSLLDEKIRKGSFLHRKFEDRPIDILFIGHASVRRQHFLAKNAAFFAKYNCYFYLTVLELGVVLDTKNKMNTRTAVGLAQRSKIILNIHHGTHPYFEWHRMVMHGFWQRGLVISDICGEAPPFVAGRDFVHAPLDELPQKIAYFLETKAGKEEAKEKIQSAYTVLTSQCDLAHKLQELTEPLLGPKKAPARSPHPSTKRNNKNKKHGRKR